LPQEEATTEPGELKFIPASLQENHSPKRERRDLTMPTSPLNEKINNNINDTDIVDLQEELRKLCREKNRC
jgi:hypothetical protein